LKLRHLNAFSRKLSDGRGERLQFGATSLPRRYAFTADAARYNFTEFYSSNNAALLKLFTDSCFLLDSSMTDKNRPGNVAMSNVTARVFRMIELRGKLEKVNLRRLHANKKKLLFTPSALKEIKNSGFFTAFILNNPRYSRITSAYGIKVANKLIMTTLAL